MLSIRADARKMCGVIESLRSSIAECSLLPETDVGVRRLACPDECCLALTEPCLSPPTRRVGQGVKVQPSIVSCKRGRARTCGERESASFQLEITRATGGSIQEDTRSSRMRLFFQTYE